MFGGSNACGARVGVLGCEEYRTSCRPFAASHQRELKRRAQQKSRSFTSQNYTVARCRLVLVGGRTIQQTKATKEKTRLSRRSRTEGAPSKKWREVGTPSVCRSEPGAEPHARTPELHIPQIIVQVTRACMFREKSTTASRASLKRSGSGREMRGLDPTVLHSVPLSKQDTRGNSFLRLCNLLSWYATLAATLAVFVDVMLLFSGEVSSAEATLHCFGVVMASMIILAERETSILLKYCAFLESWLLKGLFISYVGTLLLAFEHREWLLDVWRVIAGYILIASGVLYFMLGALCFRQLRSYQLGKIRRKKVMRQELLSLSTQKQEIEKLLADTESKLELL